MAKFKITQKQYDQIIESILDTVDETHVESDPFTKYSNKTQEKLAHGKEHDKKKYKNPHLKEQEDDMASSLFDELDNGLLNMSEDEYNELLEISQKNNIKNNILVGAIIYSAPIPDQGDEEYQKKMLKTLMEIERKKMSNMETWIDDEIIKR